MSLTISYGWALTGVSSLVSGFCSWLKDVYTLSLDESMFVIPHIYAILRTFGTMAAVAAMCAGLLFLFYLLLCWSVRKIKYVADVAILSRSVTSLQENKSEKKGLSPFSISEQGILLHYSIDSGKFHHPDGSEANVVMSTSSQIRGRNDFSPNVSSYRTREMALNTSVFVPTGTRTTDSKGVLSIRLEDDRVLGMASCVVYPGVGSCLLTATHVWEECSLAGKTWLEHKGQKVLMDLSWKVIVHSGKEELDIVLVAVPPAVFAVLACKTLKVAPLKSGSRCTAFGYNTAGEYGLSYGMVSHTPGEAFRLTHHASTSFGWSGTPLIVGDVVVGFHTGANHNAISNEGTIIFWLVTKDKESSVTTEEESFDLVEELETAPTRVVRYTVQDVKYQLKQAGKKTAINKVLKFDSSWADTVDDEMDYSQHFSFETKKKGKSKESSNPVIPSTTIAPVVSPAGFPPGEMASVSKQLSNLSVITEGLLAEFQRTKTPTQTGPLVSALTRKRRVRKRSSTRVSASSSSATVPTAATEQRLAMSPASAGPLNTGRILQSGGIPPATLVPSEPVCSSKPVDTSVLVVRMTRKQEKLYNQISQTRKYHQAWKSITLDQKIELRARLLRYVVHSNLKLTDNPVQDFLSTFSVEPMTHC